MRRAEWVDLDMPGLDTSPMHAQRGQLLGGAWGDERPRVQTLRLQELEESRLHISVTTDGGEVVDYIFHGHYLIKWAKEDGDG